jgi:uncharacterized membrane protein YvlD (DUF360 family)
MNWEKLVLSAIAGSIGMWILAGLYHEVVMAQFYRTEVHATHEGTGIIFIAYLVLGALMAYIYPIGYKGGKPWLEGMKFGLVMGILWVFPHELVRIGAHGGSITYAFKNVAWHLVEQGVGGIIIAVIYGKSISANPAK